MKLTLNVKQRIDLQSILPEQGNFLIFRMIRVLRESLSFNKKEHGMLKFQTHENGAISWEPKHAHKCSKEVEIPEPIVKIVKNVLKKMNREGKITEAHFGFFKLFFSVSELREFETEGKDKE